LYFVVRVRCRVVNMFTFAISSSDEFLVKLVIIDRDKFLPARKPCCTSEEGIVFCIIAWWRNHWGVGVAVKRSSVRLLQKGPLSGK